MQNRLLFFSLLYGTPAPSAESQLLEAWPASHFRHLRESPEADLVVEEVLCIAHVLQALLGGSV